MTGANTPGMQSTVSLVTEQSDSMFVFASSPSHAEWELVEHAHTPVSELLSWWRHHKRSADFHLKEFLRFQELWKEESRITESQSPNTIRDLIPRDYSSSAHSENYWNMKVEKDSLIADLSAMDNILDALKETASEKAHWYLKPVLASSMLGLMSLLMMGGVASAITFIPAGMLSVYGPIIYWANLGVIYHCRSQTLSIKESVEAGRLENQNTKGVRMPLSNLLSWIS
ncbi:hypothetical protein BDV23DRAFT_153116 [Aspergillus alliaceus]|uniref:Uncharacterized protein n=1 Tax=Petromyces alliaceus TaxID=209559 RepID=A0A5N7CCI3_PETAA|nr:hypothetical protein BDV23DRAFT_153116 [Aspergillus alliaceus]